MKKIITILCVLNILGSCKDTVSNPKILPDGNYEVNGSIEGMDNGNLYLVDSDTSKKIEVTDGKFTLAGQMQGIVVKKELFLKEPEDFEQPLTVLYLEPKAMELSVPLNNPEDSKLIGSKTQDAFYAFQEGKQTIAAKYKEKLAVIEQYYTKLDSMQASEKEDLNALKEINSKLDILENEVEPYYEESNAYVSEFVKSNSDSHYLLYLIKDMMMGSYDMVLMDSIFGSLSENLQNSALGKDIAESMQVLQRGTVGELAENFASVDINGKPLSLANYRGRYVLLDFWASWCKPCRDGNPHLLKLYKEYNPKGLEIIGISDDEERPKIWRAAVEKDRIGVWKHVLRGNPKENSDSTKVDIAGLYGVEVLPTKILVDPEGKIVFRTAGGGDDDNALMDKTFADIFEK